MKKLLLGLALLISMPAFASVKNVCGELQRTKLSANASLNTELERYSTAKAVPGAKVEYIEQARANKGGLSSRLLDYSACLLIEIED